MPGDEQYKAFSEHLKGTWALAGEGQEISVLCSVT
jgi:hypothetical protein